MTDRGPAALTGWRIDRRTFLKALGLGGVSIVAGSALGARLTPFVTPAAAQTSPIDDLALQLQFDPERIFRFVADEIRYQPYAGLLRGAEGTRLAKAGNAADQAALLAALLTASGINVRFVEGVLDASHALALREGSALDSEAIAMSTLQAIVETRLDGSLPERPQPDAEAQRRAAQAVASAEHVLAWTRAQVLDTVELLESALASVGVTVPQSAEIPETERNRHVWLQMAAGPAWIDLDPSIPGAVLGRAVVIPAAVMDVLPDDLRHRLDFRVIAETIRDGSLAQETLLEGSDHADALVGVPIGFLNIEQDGLKALGASVTSALSGGTTYLPCLIVGEDVVVGPGAIRFGGLPGAADDVFATPSGDPAQALDGEPTAEWLEVTITSPGAKPVTTRREIFDRIGPAARRDGIGPVGLAPAELVPLESGAPPDFLPAQTSHWLSVETAIVPASRIERLSTGSEDPGHLTTPVQGYHLAQASASAALADDLGGHWFPDAPNIVSFTVTQEMLDGQLAMRPILDIWHRSLGRTPTTTMSTQASPLTGGVLAHVAERIVAGDADPAADGRASAASVGAVFEVARSQGQSVLTLTSPADLDALPFSAEPKARIAGALEAGHVVVVPERPVTLQGAERTGWWRIDPVSGRAVDEMDDARGTIMGDVARQIWNLVKASPAFHRLGLCVGLTFMGVAGAWLAVGGVYTVATSGAGADAALGAVAAALGGANAGGGGIGFWIYCS